MPGSVSPRAAPIRSIVASSTIEQCSIRWRGSGRGSVPHRFFVGVENQVDRRVADGVDPDLEAGAVRPKHLSLHDLRRLHPEADVLRLPLDTGGACGPCGRRYCRR